MINFRRQSLDHGFPALTRKEHLKYFTLFAVLAIAFSWQLILNFDKTGIGDALLQPYYYWWVKTALSSLQNPYYTDYIFFPQGANLAFGFGMIPDAILMLPITILFGANQAVNLSFIAGYMLSGYFTFLLCHDLTGNKKASFIGGLIFAFSPYHVSLVPHQMILACAQWIPFYIFMFRRALICDKRKWSVFAGLVMAVIILTDQMQAIFSVIVTALLLIIICYKKLTSKADKISQLPEYKQMSIKILIMVIVSAIISSFYLFSALDFLLTNTSALKITPFEHGGPNQFGADILGFIVPTYFNPIWGALFKPVGMSCFFLGYLPLILAVIGAKQYSRSGVTKIVLIITMIAFILSLGITLKFNGQWEWNGKLLKLPYYYLYNFPPISLIRTPYRFHLLTTLGMALLASYGVTYLIQAKSKKLVGILIPIFVIVIILEFLPSTGKYGVAAPVPEIYHQMARDREPYSVLTLPLSRWTSLVKNGSGSPSELMYFQTVHGKKMFNGFSSRVGNKSLEFGSTILEVMKDVSTYDNYEIHVFGKRKATENELAMAKEEAVKLVHLRDEFIKSNNLRYIIINAPISYQGSMTRLFIETFLGRPMDYDPDSNIAYIKVGSL